MKNGLLMKQKIIFWLDADLTSYCLAYYLQQRIDAEFYAIIDITNRAKEFFLNQKLVTFQKVWFYHDYVMKSTKDNVVNENESGLNISELVKNDRIFNPKYNEFYNFTKNEINSIITNEFSLFNEVLQIKPNIFVTTETALRPHHTFHKLCQAQKIKTLMLNNANWGNLSYLSENFQELDNFEMNFKHRQTTSNTFEQLEKRLQKKILSKNLTNFYTGLRKSKLEKIFAALQFLLISNNDHIKTHYTYFGRTKLKVLLKYFKYSIQKKIRKNFIDKNLIKEINPNDSFIYFPLHMEQERSTLIDAPFNTDQLQVVKQIVKSLPVGINLYVKEHPSMKSRNWRSISIYKELIRLPNVTLLHPSVNPNLLLEKCSLVIVITGTAAFDAGFYGKPAITFVETEFSSLEHISVLKKDAELPELIRNSLKKSINPEIIQEYIEYVEKNAILIDMNSLQQDIQDVLSYGGYLVDVEINDDEFRKLLESKKEEFNLLADEHIKKII